MTSSTPSTTFGTRPRPCPTQQPSPMPFQRYRAFTPVDLPDRTWPSKQITKPHDGCPLICGTATRL